MSRSCTVCVLESGSFPRDAADCLASLEYRLIRVESPQKAVQETAGPGVDLLVVGVADLAAVAEARQGVSRPSLVPPVLALIGEGEAADALAAGADDCLVWPAPASLLELRVEGICESRQAAHELALRATHAKTLQELSAVLGAGVEYEELLLDVLLRVTETTCARGALVLVRGDDSSGFVVAGSTEDPGAVRLPVNGAEHPEAGMAMHSHREIWLRAGDEEASGPVRSALRRRGLACLGVYPLLWDGEAYACMEVFFEDEAALPEPTLELLREVATLIAYSLRQSELYRGLKEQTQKTALRMLEGKREVELLQKYAEFFERAYDGILVVDRKLRVLHMNPAGEQITGYSRRGILGRWLGEIVDPAYRELLQSAVSAVGAKPGAAPSFDLAVVTTSGDPIIVSVSTSAVLAHDEMIVLSFRDVTESRELENELRSTKEFLERLIDSTVDAIVATDVEGRVILFNKGAERIFGLPAEEVIGKLTMRELYPDGAAEQVMNHLRGPDDGGVGRLEAVRKEVLNSSHELVPVLLSANLIYEDGAEVGTVGIYSDLRERLRIERTLAQAQEKLIATEKQALIAELAGTTAHELNQPLTSIMGYAELLKRRIAQDDSNHRAVDTILAEAERMAEIVRKIGKITRYETKAYVGGAQILDLEKSSEE
jgi:PAS domain S-box-containing protein